jgi:hypothetical protein
VSQSALKVGKPEAEAAGQEARRLHPLASEEQFVRLPHPKRISS